MAIILKADNRALVPDREYTYLDDNYSSGQTALKVRSVSLFKNKDYLLFVDFGSENSEIRQIVSIDAPTNTFTINKETEFAHSESTKIMSLAYNKIRFERGDLPDFDSAAIEYLIAPTPLGDNTTTWNITSPIVGTTRWEWAGGGTNPEVYSHFSFAQAITDETATISGGTINEDDELDEVPVTAVGTDTHQYFEVATATFSGQTGMLTGTAIINLNTSYQSVDSASTYTILSDENNITGYGFFQWINTTTYNYSQSRNPIPYIGFPPNSARSIIDSFFSTLNNKELKLISRTDAFNWLNEGYAVLLNELNLINKEYSAELPVTINIIADQAEYLLPANVSRVLSVWDNENNGEVSEITNAQISAADYGDNKARYYLRGVKDVTLDGELYIGFSPVPTGVATVKVRYVPKAVTLYNNFDSVYVPNNNFYCLKDYMLFRASPKLNRGVGNDFYQLFQNSVQRMKIDSKKQGSGLDSWGADPSTMV